MHIVKRVVPLILLINLFALICLAEQKTEKLPEGFVYVGKIIPEIEIELRYYTSHNFVGKRIDGYLKARCILTEEAANALKKVQKQLKPFGLGLKIFDAYRPQQAVDHFVRWAENLSDIRMKEEFYPNVIKENLFRDDYITARSSHSRGSTVDLTIMPFRSDTPDKELDMGSSFDFFGQESWPHHPDISTSQRAHRMLLQCLMKKHGFKPYPKEWWHFTLKNEPFPDTYFNFPIQ